MKKRRRQRWTVGNLFTVPQLDGDRSLGQVLDVPLPNVASCAFFDLRFPGTVPTSPVHPPDALAVSDAIAALWTTPDLLDIGKWVVVGHQEPVLSGESLPNEDLRSAGWIGAVTYGSGIVEQFLDAFYGLRAWDDWHDPQYLDRLLISPEKKPRNLVYVRRER